MSDAHRPAMRYLLLGRSGLRVSELALGTGTFGTRWGWGADPAESRRVFDGFAEAGDDNLGALRLDLGADHLARLDAASAVPLGFPHEMLAAPTSRALASGGQWEQIVHRFSDPTSVAPAPAPRPTPADTEADARMQPA